MKTDLKVLIVDDDPDASTLLKHYLGKLPLWEIRFTTCQTGREALLKIREQPPDTNTGQ